MLSLLPSGYRPFLSLLKCVSMRKWPSRFKTQFFFFLKRTAILHKRNLTSNYIFKMGINFPVSQWHRHSKPTLHNISAQYRVRIPQSCKDIWHGSHLANYWENLFTCHRWTLLSARDSKFSGWKKL